MSTFIIAEVGVNHNGNIDRAHELIDISASLGADAVKFQTFFAEGLSRKGAPKAEYQERQTGGGDQVAMLSQLELSRSDHFELARKCASRGVEFMSTPFDLESADFLAKVGVKRLKLPSGDIDNKQMLLKFASLDLPIIMSTGMAELEEIRAAKEVLETEWARLAKMQGRDDRLCILHCTSNYPAALEDVNLRAMQTIGSEFGCPVGYSDHTDGIMVSAAAVAMGAAVIEKHVTLDRSLPGPDHAASLEPGEFAKMVKQIRSLEVALGDGKKVPRESEIPVRDVVRRSICLARDVSLGERIAESDLVMLRPGEGISPMRMDEIIGRSAIRALPAGSPIQWSDLGE